MVVECGELVFARRSFPGNGLSGVTTTNETPIGKPVEFAHARVGLGAQWNSGFCNDIRDQNLAMSRRRRRDQVRFATTSGFGFLAIQKRRRHSPWRAGAFEKREQISRPEFVNFAPQRTRAVIARDPQTSRDIDKHFAMHVTGFDWRNSRDKPAFDSLRTMRSRQIAGDAQNSTRFRFAPDGSKMARECLRPTCAQTVDDSEQERRRGRATDKRRISFAIEVTDPDSRAHNDRRPRLTTRREIRARCLSSSKRRVAGWFDAIETGTRNHTKHFEC